MQKRIELLEKLNKAQMFLIIELDMPEIISEETRYRIRDLQNEIAKYESELTSLDKEQGKEQPQSAYQKAVEILTYKWGKPQMDDTTYPNQYLKNMALEAMQEFAITQKQSVVLPTEEEIMLYFAKHCKKSEDMKINYQVFRRGEVIDFAKWVIDFINKQK